MKRWRKLRFLAAAMALSMLLAACSTPGSTQSTASSSSPSANTSTTGSGDASDDTQDENTEIQYPLEGSPSITIVRKADPDLPTVGISSYNESEGVKTWSERTGVNINVIEPADDNALMVYLASGNLADIVIMAIRGVYPGDVAGMVADGIASDLTDELPVYAPDYWNFINGNDLYLSGAREPDGKYYSIVSTVYPEGSPYRHWFGLVARQEYLDQLNMEAPSDIDSLYEYLKRCKDELGVETPFMSDILRWNHMFDYDGCLTSPFGLVSTGLYVDNGEVHYGMYEDSYKDFLIWLNKLYNEGLLDPNFTLTDEPTAHAAILSGKSALMVTAASRVANLMTSSDASDFTLVGLPSMKKEDGSQAYYSFASTYIEGSFTAFIPEGTPDDRRQTALMALNYLFTDEGHMMTNFGVEGETYDMVDEEPILNEFMTNNPDGKPLDGMLRAYAMLNWPMWYEESLLEQRYAMPAQTQAIKAWAESDSDSYQIQNTSISPEFVDEYASLWTDIDTYMKEYRSQFISGAKSPDTFESEYIPTLQQMQMDRVMEILQASYEKYN